MMLKTEQTKKSDSKWDPEPYTVTDMKGTMVTASRNGHIVTRNSGFFKPFYSVDDSEIPLTKVQTLPSPHEPQPSNSQVTTPLTPSSDTHTSPHQAIPAATSSNQTGKRRFRRPTKEESRMRAEEQADKQPTSQPDQPRRSERLKAKSSA